MSTAGSVRNDASRYTPPETSGTRDPGTGNGKKRRPKIFRWQGILPLLVVGTLAIGGWVVFGDRVARGTLSEAGTKAFGAEFSIADMTIRTFSTTVEMRGVTLADPFDSTRNLVEVGRLSMQLEPRPLLEKKVVVKRLSIADVRTGTRRGTPARAVAGGGFAPRALAEVQRFAQQFKVPLLSLTPIDTLKAIALDPTQLKAVQAALSLGRRADSTKSSIEQAYAGLRLQETIDSSAALAARLQGSNVRTLGVDGARTAIADVRRARARVDSARGRVERMVADAKRGVDSLQAGARALDDARREDYEFARGLLKLPSLETPDIGAALFGKVTIDKLQQALYWSTLARKYAPPGLLPRESEGPKRMRRSGSTIHFVTPESYPRFLLRRANISVVGSGESGSGNYGMAASDITSDPAIVKQPTRFAVRRTGRGGRVDSLRINGSLDHVAARPTEIVNASGTGVQLPPLVVPAIPYKMDPGRGSSELRFVLDGNQLSGRWSVRSSNVSWTLDSARARRLNTIETLVARVLTGVRELELTAEVSGTISEPRLAIRSNLDRQVAERLRSVAGEEIAVAEGKMRAQVDRLVEEKSAPVKARINEIRAESERRVADARARLDEEKRKLEERLKSLGSGLGLPRLPGE
jgi:uncharacterized protein (TIGR03545 family)